MSSPNVSFEQAVAELPILRGFIDFVNQQVGVYMDCLAGFEGNRVRMERQVARILRPSSTSVEDGIPIVTWTSLEDPSQPDVIHTRIIRAEDYLRHNAEMGSNERQVCWSIIVFMFAFWDEEVRPRVAAVRAVPIGEVTLDALGDLRVLRNAIVHNQGRLEPKDHGRLRVMGDLTEPGRLIAPSHDQMHRLFVHIKQAVAALLMDYAGRFPGAPDLEKLKDVAIHTPV